VSGARPVSHAAPDARPVRRPERLAAAGVAAGGVADVLSDLLVDLDREVRAALDDPRRAVRRRILARGAVEARRAGALLHAFRHLVDERDLGREAVDVGAVVREAVGLLEPRLARRAVAVHLDLGPVERALARRPVVLQVLVCVLVDALATLPDGGDLAVRLRRFGPRLWLDLRHDGEPGTGSEPALFEGELGLFLAHRLIGEVGGSLRRESRPGRGTLVRVTFEVVGADAIGPLRPAGRRF
jgi:C4-dicarboxylate-specific signal transduction histidine kinase